MRLGFLTPVGVLVPLLAASACRTGSAARAGVPPAGGVYDPVTMDPAESDSAYPAQMAELALESGGERLNAILYVAAGRGPHGVVVLLHGNPGNERNLDIAQAIRRAGYSVLFFNYRGSWGSGGTFSRTHAIEDVHAALRWVRSSETAARFRIDTTRIASGGPQHGRMAGTHGHRGRRRGRVRRGTRLPKCRCVRAPAPARLLG
jgi:hypothetical protein